MNAARVVADHPAERAPAVRSRIGTKRPPVRVRGVLQIVERQPWLDASCTDGSIDPENPIEMLRRVDDDRHIAALTGDARSRAAREHGRAVLMTDLDGIDDVIGRAGNDNANRHLAIVGRVGCVECTVAGAEAYLAGSRRAKILLQRVDVQRTSKRLASLRFSSRPRPGRDKSGYRHPSVRGRGAPSKSICSMRT